MRSLRTRIDETAAIDFIAKHSVEGCDHFPHDGDDDDLGFFVGVGEAIVEGLEGGTVSTCAEGGRSDIRGGCGLPVA